MAAMCPVLAWVPMQAIFPSSIQQQLASAEPTSAEMAAMAFPPPTAETAPGSRRRGGRGSHKTGPPPQRQCAQVFKKTSICRYFPRCHQGDQCKFAHTSEELRVRPNLTKTRMCAGYFDGRCRLSASECGFAHGDEDLRPREVPYFTDPLPEGFGTAAKPGPAAPKRIADRSAEVLMASAAEIGLISRAPSTSAGSSSPAHSAAASTRSGLVTPEVLPEAETPEEVTPPASPRTEDDFTTQTWTPDQCVHEDSAQVDELMEQWIENLKALGSQNQDHVPAFFPTSDECKAALARAMPEYYED